MTRRLFETTSRLLSQLWEQEPGAAQDKAIVPPAAAPETQQPPAVLALTDDDQLIDLLIKFAGPGARVEAIPDCEQYSDLRTARGCNVVVFDDSAVAQDDRHWLLGRIRNDIPGALLIYVAGHHDADTERAARTAGAGCYLAKPVDQERLSLLIDNAIARERGGPDIR